MTKPALTIDYQIKIFSNCPDKLIKYGKTSNGNQRYKCKNCQKTRVEIYSYNAYLTTINYNIVQLTKEGLGIRSTARYLKISTTMVYKKYSYFNEILAISDKRINLNYYNLILLIK